METRFSLGNKVKDKITGYKGTITSVCFSINRPVSYLVEGIDTTGRPISDWVDGQRLQLDETEKSIDDNKYNEVPKEKLKESKYISAIKAAKEAETKKEEHDCRKCEMALICPVLNLEVPVKDEEHCNFMLHL
jgi:hypothetical protein